MIGEKEYRFLDLLSKEKEISQRKLAKSIGISLGMTNLILKKLVRKGYIKIKGLNRKKVKYILTPKGFAEKARKSYNYTVKTIKEFLDFSQKLREFFLDEYRKGTKEFLIKGDGEILRIIDFVFKTLELPDIRWKKLNTKKKDVFIITKDREVSLMEII